MRKIYIRASWESAMTPAKMPLRRRMRDSKAARETASRTRKPAPRRTVRRSRKADASPTRTLRRRASTRPSCKAERSARIEHAAREEGGPWRKMCAAGNAIVSSSPSSPQPPKPQNRTHAAIANIPSTAGISHDRRTPDFALVSNIEVKPVSIRSTAGMILVALFLRQYWKEMRADRLCTV